MTKYTARPETKGSRGMHGVCMLSHFSCVLLFATLWAVAHQAPLSLGFSRKDYWDGLPFSSGDLPEPGIEPVSLTSPTLAGRLFTTSATQEAGGHKKGERERKARRNLKEL